MSLYAKSVRQQTEKTNKPNQLYSLGKLPGFLIVGLITTYQWTLSPDHGIVSLYTFGVCKYRPTCSEYTKQAIQKHGVLKGVAKGWKQIKTCH